MKRTSNGGAHSTSILCSSWARWTSATTLTAVKTERRKRKDFARAKSLPTEERVGRRVSNRPATNYWTACRLSFSSSSDGRLLATATKPSSWNGSHTRAHNQQQRRAGTEEKKHLAARHH